jgi:predicted Zn-dependent protease
MKPPVRFGRRGFGVLLLAVALGLILGNGYGQYVFNRRVAPIRAAITAASLEGLQYPEARWIDPEDREAVSAARKTGAVDLEPALAELRARFDENPGDPKVAFWLAAGYTVSGQLATARAAVDIIRVHRPYETRLWNLDAILTLAEGDRALARDRLEALLERAPGDDLARENLARLEPDGED